MALVVEIDCGICGRHETTTISSGGVRPEICSGCQKATEDSLRMRHFQGLDAMAINDRLRRVEKWIYDYKPPINPLNIRY